MAVVQVRSNGIVPKAIVVGRQIVHVAYQNRLAIFRVIDRPWCFTVKSPKSLGGQIRGHGGGNLRLRDLVKLLWRKLGKRLVRDRASFAACGVGSDCRRWIHRGYWLFHGQIPEWLNKRPGYWAGSSATATIVTTATTSAFAAMVKAPGPRAQAVLCH